MQGPLRKVFHAVVYELIAIVVVTLAMQLMAKSSTAQAGGLALATTVVALLWNMAYNTLFEHWEKRQLSKARNMRRRVAHAIGFEAGLVLMTVPMIAWWMNMDWVHAFLADLALVAFFLVYTFVFNWVFDKLFGLPAALH